MDEQQQGEAPAENTDAWGELAGRLEGVLDAEQGGGVGVGGGLAGAAGGGEIAPQGLPVLDRLAQLTERLEATLSGGQEAPYNPVAGPGRAPRAEDVMPGPTAFPGYANPSGAFHGGAPFGIDQESLPAPQPPAFVAPEPPAYAGLPPLQDRPAAWATGVQTMMEPNLERSGGAPPASTPTFETPPAPPWGELPGLNVQGAPAAAGPEAPSRAGAPAAQAPAMESPAAPAGRAPAFEFAPPAPAYGDLPGVAGAGAPAAHAPEMPAPRGAPAGDSGAFPDAAPPPYSEQESLWAGGGAAADYPRLPMAEGEAPAAAAAGKGSGESEGGGVLGELVDTVRLLKDAVAGLQAGGGRGSRERRPGPQRDGSFVPGGPGSIFGTFPEVYERHP